MVHRIGVNLAMDHDPEREAAHTCLQSLQPDLLYDIDLYLRCVPYCLSHFFIDPLTELLLIIDILPLLCSQTISCNIHHFHSTFGCVHGLPY